MNKKTTIGQYPLQMNNRLLRESSPLSALLVVVAVVTKV